MPRGTAKVVSMGLVVALLLTHLAACGSPKLPLHPPELAMVFSPDATSAGIETVRGSLTEIGTFTEILAYHGFSLSDHGEYLAFVTQNFDNDEVWVVKRDGTGLRRILSASFDPEANESGRHQFQLLGWEPEQGFPNRKHLYVYAPDR